jgi:exocyst complex component 2
MNIDNQKILEHYGLSEQFPLEWNDPKAFLDLESSGNTGELSKYALLRQLVASSNTSASLAQDEADPLGSTPSVMSVLRARNIDVDNDPNVRARYLISSTKFSPKLFMRDVHLDATYNNLVNSLDYLEKSVAKRSEALRDLVEKDYDRFVKSKSLLDDVLKHIEDSGFNSQHEYGLGKVKSLIDDANSKATVIMKPVIDNQKREDRLRRALLLIEKNRYLFNLPGVMAKHIKNNDFDSLVRDYRRGRDMKYNEDIPMNAPDYVYQNKKITDRIWHEVEAIIDDYKRELWKKLSTTGTDQNYMLYISRLLELGVEDNPIMEWIQAQIQIVTQQVTETFDKLKLRANLMRVNLVTVPPSLEFSYTELLKEFANVEHSGDGSPGLGSSENMTGIFDSVDIVEMWLTIKNMISDIARIASDACAVWHYVNDFLDGTRQESLPTGYQGESKIHLQFSLDQINEIKRAGRGIIDLFDSSFNDFFTTAAGPTMGSLNGSSGGKEGYLFIPPAANCIGSVYYLTQILSIIASMFKQLSGAFKQLSGAKVAPQASDILRNRLSIIRERSATAICSIWIEDCKNFAALEDWSLSSQNKSFTKIPLYCQIFQAEILHGMKNMMTFTVNGDDSSESSLVSQPSSRLTGNILHGFTQSTTNIFESLTNLLTVENSKNETNALSELAPLEMTLDSKILLLLSNTSEVRDNVLPGLYKAFESLFSLPTRDISIQLRNTVDQFENNLFEVYTRQKRSAISEVIRNGISKSNWNSNKQPVTINNYIFECLLMMVIVHSKVYEVSPVLVNRVVVVLFEHLVKTVLTCLREIEKLGKGGILQAIADIEFVVRIMHDYRTPESQNSYQLIYSTLKNASIDKTLWNSRDGPRQYIEQIVDRCVEQSKLDFICFQKRATET